MRSLSPFPPDRWIRSLNQRYPSLWTDLRKAYESPAHLLSSTGKVMMATIPEWCSIEHPVHRGTLSGSIRSPREPQVWDVGVRISRFLKRGTFSSTSDAPHIPNRADDDTRSSPRRHIRSAHWHTYWTRPRTAEFPVRKPMIKWIPPIPIGMDWKTELPTNVKTVEGA